MRNRIINLSNKVDNLKATTASLKGKVELSESLFIASTEQLETLKENQEINAKAIEVLNLIQHQTRDKIKEVFESVVSKALCYIYQSDDYQFELDFQRHGNTPKMTFLLKDSRLKEKHDILNTTAGGSRDVISVALRFVLLEVSKTPGFLFLDEIDKRLDNSATEKKMLDFIIENQKASGRQIFLITHKQSFVDSVPNPIIFNRNGILGNNIPQIIENKEVVDIEPQVKKKRGRPKSGVSKDRSK